MKNETVYDILGIGIGPFNLGMAALACQIPNLKCKFFDQNISFSWHPGLLLPETRLQVPFYADLVTLADPTSPFSFLSFLKAKGRMFRFAIRDNNFVTRYEYDQYCQWVTEQLPCLQFGLKCEAVHYDETQKIYTTYLRTHDGLIVRFHGKQIVIGVGTVPAFPDCAENVNHALVFHSADYLFKKEQLLKLKNISIVGSGQSAAEIFYDLLQDAAGIQSLSWFTRAEYIFPMDNSKFAFEFTSPDYIDHFYDLSTAMKKKILPGQDRLYKGVNRELIDAIQEKLYMNRLHNQGPQTKIYLNSELDQIQIESDSSINLQFFHRTQEEFYDHQTNACILATGYKNMIPDFLQPIKHRICWNEEGFYSVNKNYSVDPSHSIFVQNADLHSHGFNSADLGMGPFRNAIILNTIRGREHFKMEPGIAFQQFGLPS